MGVGEGEGCKLREGEGRRVGVGEARGAKWVWVRVSGANNRIFEN